MKNSIKILAVKTLFLFWLLPAVNLAAQTTITSTTTGGKWNDVTTWVGGGIPTANNHVVINGPVYINGTFSCMNLTINSNAELYNDVYSTVTLTVTGNLINKGKISTHPTSGYRLSVSVKGNIENNGIWTVQKTFLSGNSNQYLKQGAGAKFEGEFETTDDNGDIVLNSNVNFLNSSWDLKSSRILTNGYRLITLDYHLKNGFIVSNDHLELNNTVVSGLTFDGTYKLHGKIRIQNGIVFKGQATLLDTLHNDTYYTTTLVVEGDMVNEGYLITHPSSGYRMSVDLWKDLENKGVWAPYQTTFKAVTNQQISQASGKKFEGYFAKSDSLGQIVLDSDVVFDNNIFDLAKSTLNTNGHLLQTINFKLQNGKIASEDRMLLENSILAQLSFSGNYKLDGKIRIQYGIVFKGNTTLLDTLHNDTYYNTTLVVEGDMVNEGYLITHPSSGYRLSVDLWKDLENKGVWVPYQTTFKAVTNQQISQASDKKFEGYFAKSDSLGQIVLGSDVVFNNNTFDLAKSTLNTNGHLLQTINFKLQNGKIASEDRMLLENSILAQLSFSGNYKLDGKIRIQYGIVFKGNTTLLDTLHNDTYYNTTLVVEGDMVNEGYLISHPSSSYRLRVDLWSDLENKGIWAPYQTTFKAVTDQQISQASGKKFEGYFTKSDSLGQVVLGSDVVFDNNTFDLAKSTLNTNEHLLQSNNYSFSNGKIWCNDTVFFNDTKLSGITAKGNFVLKGKVRIQNNNTFEGIVTLADSLFNDTYYNSTLKISGNLINEGYLINNPSGYRLSLSINGNIENNKHLSIQTIYLTGSNERTIGGKNVNGIEAAFYVDDSIVLTGSNTLPNLNFTSNPEAGCLVKEGAVLNIRSAVSNASKIKNYGRVGIEQEMDNSFNKTYTFFAASASVPGNPEFLKLTVDNYGYQQHPTATGTINTWWRLRNSPGTYNDSLNWLKLTYPDDALNGANEDSIMVFHSPNSGLTWKTIRADYTVDKEKNEVTINKAPSWGHYLLSSSALGITSFQPLVESAEPRFGGNSGQLTMYIFGAGFKNSTTVKLQRPGQTTIVADTTMLTDIFGESMLARFNLKGQSLGSYDVVVETPGETTITLTNYFTIEQGERSDPWSAIAGRNRFLLNRWSTFNLSYGNTANTDALGTILVYVVDDLPGLEVEFPDVNIILPKTLVEMGPDFTRFSDSLDIYYVSDSLSGYEGQNMRIYPFYIPYIAAGSSNSVRVRVKLTGTGSLNMDSWILDPLYEVIDYNLKSAEPMPAEVRACITAAAMKAWYGGMVSMGASVVPGLACWSIIDKTIDPIGYITPEELKPEGKETWGSWLWKGVSIMGSAVQCGASFVPVIGTAVSLGISMVNTTIDMKDGYDATEGCWRKFRKKSQSKLKSNGVSSFDPNEKAGPQGYTADRYIPKEGNLNYTIFFENLPTAGASALEVFITDTLDVTKFDFSTFSFHTIAFADTSIKIQQYAKEFQVLVDLFPKKETIVQIHGKLDTLTGIVKWDFHSLDRQTMELTEDPDGGFLPPNKISPEGEGHVTFSCKLKSSVQHNDLISNRASIVFDLNKPIITNTFSNRIDDRIPESTIFPLALAQEDSVFTVSWTGSDQGSQIENYNIFVSVNDSAYVLWKIAKTAGSAEFTGKDGYQYRFFSVATDSIGFAEPYKTSAEAVTVVDVNTGSGLTGNVFAEIQVYPNPADQYCTVAFNMKNPGEVEILLHDITGRTTYRKTRDFWPSGLQRARLDLKDIPDGLYLVQIKAGEYAHYIKLIKRAE